MSSACEGNEGSPSPPACKSADAVSYLASAASMKACRSDVRARREYESLSFGRRQPR